LVRLKARTTKRAVSWSSVVYGYWLHYGELLVETSIWP